MVKKILKIILILLFWISVWGILSLIVNNSLILPSPFLTLLTLYQMMLTPELYQTVALSLIRVMCGIIIGVTVGIVGGIVCSFCKLAKDILSPAIFVIKSTPVASFIILLVLWLTRDVATIIISALMVTPIVWTNIETGITNTDKRLIELSKAYRFSKSKEFKEIYIPSAYPYLLSALSASLGLAWKAGIAAEVLLQPLISIGKQIFESKYMLETPKLFAWTLIVIVLSISIEKTILKILSSITKRAKINEGGYRYD